MSAPLSDKVSAKSPRCANGELVETSVQLEHHPRTSATATPMIMIDLVGDCWASQAVDPSVFRCDASASALLSDELLPDDVAGLANLSYDEETRSLRIVAAKDDDAAATTSTIIDTTGIPTLTNKPLKDIDVPFLTDVLLRGGRKHPGNKTYRKLVNRNKFLCLGNEGELRLNIAKQVVRLIRELSGRFLEKDITKGTWFDVGNAAAVQLTCDRLAGRRTTNKQKRRQQINDHDHRYAPAMSQLAGLPNATDSVVHDGTTTASAAPNHQSNDWMAPPSPQRPTVGISTSPKPHSISKRVAPTEPATTAKTTMATESTNPPARKRPRIHKMHAKRSFAMPDSAQDIYDAGGALNYGEIFRRARGEKQRDHHSAEKSTLEGEENSSDSESSSSCGTSRSTSSREDTAHEEDDQEPDEFDNRRKSSQGAGESVEGQAIRAELNRVLVSRETDHPVKTVVITAGPHDPIGVQHGESCDSDSNSSCTESSNERGSSCESDAGDDENSSTSSTEDSIGDLDCNGNEDNDYPDGGNASPAHVIDDAKRTGRPNNPKKVILDGIKEPTERDILWGRGAARARLPSGNTNLGKLVDKTLQDFDRMFELTLEEKLSVALHIVGTIRRQGGRFLEKDRSLGTWYDIGDEKATNRIKIQVGDAQRHRMRNAEMSDDDDEDDEDCKDGKSKGRGLQLVRVRVEGHLWTTHLVVKRKCLQNSALFAADKMMEQLRQQEEHAMHANNRNGADCWHGNKSPQDYLEPRLEQTVPDHQHDIIHCGEHPIDGIFDDTEMLNFMHDQDDDYEINYDENDCQGDRWRGDLVGNDVASCDSVGDAHGVTITDDGSTQNAAKAHPFLSSKVKHDDDSDSSTETEDDDGDEN